MAEKPPRFYHNEIIHKTVVCNNKIDNHMKIPKVFISYSHDSIEHKKWVLDLATRTRNNGIDSILDLWELKPGDDLPHFMETNLNSSDKIIMICTERYVNKANSGSGGVGYEKMIITSNLLTNINENKIIPIIKQSGKKELPTFLKSKLYIDFSTKDDFEFSFDELLRVIHGSPLFKKPEVGNSPFKIDNKPVKDLSKNSIIDLIKIMIDNYELGIDDTPKNELRKHIDSSRVYFEHLLNEAIELKYIKIWSEGYYLTDSGKSFAVENGLVDFK